MDQKPEFMIEVFYKKLQIYILPKVDHHLRLKKPSGVFISRKATVLDYRRKIAEILYDNTNKEDCTVEDIMRMARIWRLDTGETVYDAENLINYEDE